VQQLIQRFLTSTAFAASVFLICFLLRRKASKRAISFAEFAALGLLILPFRIDGISSMAGNIGSLLLGQARSRNNVALDHAILYADATPATTPNFGPVGDVERNVSLALVVWGAGVLFFLLYFTACYIHLHRWMKRNTRPVSIPFVFDDKCGPLSKRKIRTLVSEKPTSPFTYGIFRPRIILPEWCLSLQEDELRMILAHECSHATHFDVVKNAVAMLAVSVFWFNPAAWFLRKQMQQNIEMACDSDAVKSGDKKRYAELLVKTFTHSQSSLAEHWAAHSLRKRIENLRGLPKAQAVVSFLAIVLVFAAMLLYGNTMPKDFWWEQGRPAYFTSEDRPENESKESSALLQDKWLIANRGGYHVITSSVTMLYTNLGQGWTLRKGEKINLSAKTVSAFENGQLLKVCLVNESAGTAQEIFCNKVTNSLEASGEVEVDGKYCISVTCFSSDPIAVESIKVEFKEAL